MVAMMGKRETLAMRYGKTTGYVNSLWSGSYGGGASVCVRCPKVHPVDHPSSNRAVSVSFTFQGKSMCPEHTLEVIHEAGLTLDEAMGA